MSLAVPVTTTEEQPRETVVRILKNSRQFGSLYVDKGETVTIPANEVWYIEGTVQVQGTLNVNGDLVTAPLWDHGQPEIARWEETPMKAKQNASEPYIYVHKPAGGSIDRFSASGDLLNEMDTIQLSIWYPGDVDDTPSSQLRAKRYRDNLIDLFRVYMNDNFSNTEFHNIEPTDASDFRHQNNSRQTDHYVYSVTVEADRLQ
jgi:hypothetical protein